MRARPVFVLSVAALLAGGCGGDGDREPAARALEPVALEVSGPLDEAVVQGDAVDVQGTVSPAGSSVRVLGSSAEVSDGGAFTASVALEPGVNVIDVIASARGRDPAMTALRVTREMPVPVPDLEGLVIDEAQEELAAVGLEVEVERGGGLFDDLLPGDLAVCEQSPEAGSEVRRGTTVHVEVSRGC
jgi:hypothetical protein